MSNLDAAFFYTTGWFLNTSCNSKSTELPKNTLNVLEQNMMLLSKHQKFANIGCLQTVIQCFLINSPLCRQ